MPNQKKFGPNDTVKSDGNMGNSTNMIRHNPQSIGPTTDNGTQIKPSGEFPQIKNSSGRSPRHKTA